MRESADSRKGLTDFVEYAHAVTGRPLTVVEVGSYAGESMKLAMETGLVSEMHCVDPWKPGYDDADQASSTDMPAVEAMFDEAAAAYPGKVHKFKGDFEAFRAARPDVKPDLVYIDAEHTYKGCSRDIETALGTGAFLVGGHDYHPNWPGVVKAVNERFGRPGLTFSDSSWLCLASQAKPVEHEPAVPTAGPEAAKPAKKPAVKAPTKKSVAKSK